MSFPVDVPLDVIFFEHTFELADVEAVLAVTVFLKRDCEPVAARIHITALGVNRFRLR